MGKRLTLVHRWRLFFSDFANHFEYWMNKTYLKINMNPNRSTQQGRRDLLWNISEPGDPYDIKK